MSPGAPTGRGRRVRFEQRLLFQALLTALPANLLVIVLLWAGDFSTKVRWTVTIVSLLLWLVLVLMLRERVIHRLFTVSNLLAALREGDYTFRARGATRSDALGDVLFEINALGDLLRDRRHDALEATTLLRKIIEEIDVSVFAFVEERLQLVNRAGERLLATPEERLKGRTAEELGLGDCLRPGAPRILERTLPGGSGRWELRTSALRQGGLPMTLVVITDVSRSLRQEERLAWRRLIRVLGHELNNSLTPIRSIATSLESLFERKESRTDDWEEDVHRGISVIGSRAAALTRFMETYSRVARLPQPKWGVVELGQLVTRVAGMETRLKVEVAPGPDLTIDADPDQLEQLLINIVRNAADAALETGGDVRLGWSREGSFLDVWIRDGGPGLPESANLFVPFFTTKPEGSGVGLVLSRQIAEAHGGTLELGNTVAGTGCEARLRLPIARASETSERHPG